MKLLLFYLIYYIYYYFNYIKDTSYKIVQTLINEKYKVYAEVFK